MTPNEDIVFLMIQIKFSVINLDAFSINLGIDLFRDIESLWVVHKLKGEAMKESRHIARFVVQDRSSQRTQFSEKRPLLKHFLQKYAEKLNLLAEPLLKQLNKLILLLL